jgi:hypothetical protein
MGHDVRSGPREQGRYDAMRCDAMLRASQNLRSTTRESYGGTCSGRALRACGQAPVQEARQTSTPNSAASSRLVLDA